MVDARNIIALRVKVEGLVQGVGFRPFVYRLAGRYKLAGWVENGNDGVRIEVQGYEKPVWNFLKALENEAPQASEISGINYEVIEPADRISFEIIRSNDLSDRITEVSPDIAVCADCLEDIRTQAHRLAYPFTNCTNCGPRFTIIRDLPYDRVNTTMEPFAMCDKCKAEYTDILDRRFHAQPVACNNCGPTYELVSGNEKFNDIKSITEIVSGMLKSGKIIAVKGIGGYQLACDATNERTVLRLREAKNRETKPFAVMFRDPDTLAQYTELDDIEKQLVISWKRPIVILKEKKMLAPSVSNGFGTIGGMLPFMPFHYMLFDFCDIPALVMTSGNISDEPIVISNEMAFRTFSGFVDAILTYDRDIHNRTDDSVVFAVNGKERPIRRSRGYVPRPVDLSIDADGIFAAGAELVNCFCLGKEKQAFMSQHIGDLKNLESLEFYEESLERFKRLFRVKPTLAAADMHPDYLSTRFAGNLGIPVTAIQHHHAHIASCMAEYGLDQEVIGIAMDGTGLGDDGNIWGGEFLVCNLLGYKRHSHLEYLPLPGGDAVTKEPWRTGVSLLYKVFGTDLYNLDIPFIRSVEPGKLAMLIEALDKQINTPLSSGAGRYFDAIAAILGICTISGFHAEAPMRLEAAIEDDVKGMYGFSAGKVISLRQTVEEIVEDLRIKVRPGVISAKFHNTLADIVCEKAEEIRTATSINKIILSGGTFQNRFLLGKAENWLRQLGFEVFSNVKVPANDGGIALGQLAIAAKRRKANHK